MITQKPRPHVKRAPNRQGTKYGLLTLVKYIRTDVFYFKDKWGLPIQKSYSIWEARCECGKNIEVNTNTVKFYGQHCGNKTCKKRLMNIKKGQ